MSLSEDIKLWALATANRAVKTFSQSLVGVLTGLAAFDQIDWKVALSGAGIAALISVLQSVSGLPEVPMGSAPLEATPGRHRAGGNNADTQNLT